MDGTTNPTFLSFDDEALQKLKAAVHKMPRKQLLVAAESFLERFMRVCCHLSEEWIHSKSIEESETAEYWVQLDRLAWAFCKTSQLYRIRCASVSGQFVESNRLAHFEELTNKFYLLFSQLSDDVEKRSIVVPDKIWDAIKGVADRAKRRSESSVSLRAESEAVEFALVESYQDTAGQ